MGEGQRRNNAAPLLGSSPLSKEPLSETRSFSHGSNRQSPQSTLSLSFPFSQPYPHSPPHCQEFSLSTHLVGLVGLVDCFFNSLVVGVSHSLIFWHFWLFIDFRLVVILLLVVRGSKGFLPTPPSWLELSEVTFWALRLSNIWRFGRLSLWNNLGLVLSLRSSSLISFSFSSTKINLFKLSISTSFDNLYFLRKFALLKGFHMY